MQLYFVRHGESQANILHVISNRVAHHGLTAQGRQQAVTLAKRLHSISPARIFTSPLLRAVQTASILSDSWSAPLEITEALREYDCGILEGCSDPASWQLHRQLRDAWLVDKQWHRRLEQGESFLDIQARFMPFIERLVARTSHMADTFVLVGHGGVYACMLPLILANVDFAFVLERPFPNTAYVLAESGAAGLMCLEWCGVPVSTARQPLPPHIRPAQYADAQAVLTLAKPFATSFVVDDQAFYRAFSELLTSPQAYLAVAQADRQLVGYVLGFDHYTFFANGRVAWVEELMVREPYRRQGIGQSLMQEFETWAAGRGSQLVALATRRAAAFYRALGYEESATYFRKLL
jgi:broad specificity phosphatase PhoE/GNAT superfamily N-acetyltransferase